MVNSQETISDDTILTSINDGTKKLKYAITNPKSANSFNKSTPKSNKDNELATEHNAIWSANSEDVFCVCSKELLQRILGSWEC